MDDLKFPKKVRAAIYVTVVMVTSVVVPLDAANIIPDIVMSVWMSVAGAASALAYLNINRK